MRHLSSIKGVFTQSGLLFLRFFAIGLSLYMGAGGVGNVSAALQIAWESPAGGVPQVLREFTEEELAKRKAGQLSEVDAFAKSISERVTFTGPSLSALVDDATKTLTAADRATTDLVVLKTRSGREFLMPKAFLVKYPQIQLALKKNGQPLGAEAPRVVLPVKSNAKIRSENMLLEPMFVTELASITLTSYQKRYGAFFLERRTDPAAMRGEKLFLQNCVTCHTQPALAMAVLTAADKVEKVAHGEHPNVPGNPGFKALFDKKAIRSLVSYLEAFRFQSAKN